ncbi:substrate-binding periplasmic protein [Halopseudomonas pelagia]|uniref:Bifunctional lytic transglycosylase/amino acid ABC transporter substrate-binding protein n=1 Tax=Halopseudomonas pelagia TaxID=553151 RepID=A0AA91U4P5_9GAMM|nr:transporter substrate-binding domain-containing protein [Halopseudomonas pelagia]PCD00764.1 bifunctional lytic transglycosylase/amino acid ABC transporter substrate-binding protein [Halopseudomonas pelagia]QFY58054.1 bifunctional lytic transglycosylase/amino acid ABC transporter substrate-binding protein [Halopseudomonas pelagia]
MRVCLAVTLWMFPWPLMAGPELNPQAARPVVQVGIMRFPEYSYQNEQGKAVGVMVDLTRLLLDRAGYRSDIRILPSARIWRGLEDGEVHLWPGIVNKPGLDDLTLLTERDLTRVAINLYYLPGQPKPALPEALVGKRLILITNYTYVKSLLERLQDPALAMSFDSSMSHVGALEMLLRGRGDFLLNYRAQVDPLVAGMGLEPLPHIELAEHPMRYVLSRQSGFAEQLKADLDRAYDELAAEGVELDVVKRLQLLHEGAALEKGPE